MNNSREITIRLVKEADLLSLAQVYTHAYSEFDVGEKWTEEKALKLMQWWYKKQPDLFLLAVYQNQIVGGFMTEVMPWWDGNRLYEGEIIVDPAYQRKGIGTLLIKSMFKIAKEKYGIVEWNATAFTKFDYPLAWYKKLGFYINTEWVNITVETEKILG